MNALDGDWVVSRTRGAWLKGRYYAEVVYMDFDSGH